ncbi:glycoside hydrolase family 26 protein [Cystobasidium minutum MCA 4210]|uniref:glycoside hydrolase family 26 protein n=1 Tax=Cystobasidium minutum MCA 4210 TaxID=1397322 RepID=UPI0034CFF2CF|eukprot:jgi/Rhomi1/9422/CE9421_200
MRQSHALTLCVLAALAAIAWAGNTHYYKPDLHHRANRGPRRVQTLPKTLAKRVSNGFGLLDDSQVKYHNGIAMGWLPDFTVSGAVNSINNALDRPMSIIGDYVQIYALEDEVPTPLIQIDYHLGNVSTGNTNTQPVYMISLMPQAGLEAVTPAVIDTVVNKISALNTLGVTVWLRYAFEMNLGPEFHAWSGTPDAFKQSWNAMYTAIKEGTTDTYMLWSPNVDVNSEPNYMDYFPGEEFVDLYGISLYSFAANSRDRNDALIGTEFIETFTPFYNLFGEHPIVISETSKPYNYELNGYPSEPQPGTAVRNEAGTKVDWLTQLTSVVTKSAFPNIIAVNWFEFLKNEEGMTVDFRSLTGSSRVRNAVAAYLSS